jgi:hydrogenase maturation factor
MSDQDVGKVDRAFFDEYIYPQLGADRGDVRLGPNHGVDFGVIELCSMSSQNSESSDDAVDVGDRVLALATDPVFVLPDLGMERAAWFAVHVLLSDVAVSGLPPTHLAVDLNLPRDATDEAFAALWEVFHREAEALGVSIVTGHTGRYANCAWPTVGGGTALAVGDPADLVRPDGARPGDRVLVTEGPAVEATGVLAARFEGLLRAELPDATVDAALDRFWDASPVRDALVAAAAGPVTAMHDATEGGLLGALRETAAAAGVEIAIERDRVPVLPGVREVCGHVELDPWTASSEGTLAVTVDPEGVDEVLDALADEDVPAADVGEVREGDGLVVDGDTHQPGADSLWAAYERLAARE